MKLAREKFTDFDGERMDVDQLDSSSALSRYRSRHSRELMAVLLVLDLIHTRGTIRQ